MKLNCILPIEVLINYNLQANAINLREIALLTSVTPAKAGVQKSLKRLDSGFRRNDAACVCMRPKTLKLMTLIWDLGFYAEIHKFLI